jgi:hypothetical protein
MTKQTASLTRSKAWTCAGINQLAFPGMGTVMAGRRVGYLQAGIMVAGFVMVMVFMAWLFAALFRYLGDSTWNEAQFRTQKQSWNWVSTVGFVLCAVAWCWSLVSSIEIVRQAQQTPPVLRRNDDLKT